MARMTSFRKSVLIAVLVLIASLFLPCLAQADQQAEEQAAMRAFQKFIKYIDNADARFYNCFDAHSKQVFVERTVNTLMKTYPDKTVEPEERRQELTQIFTELLAEPDGQLAKSYMKQLRKYFLRKYRLTLIWNQEHSCAGRNPINYDANTFTLEQVEYDVTLRPQNYAWIGGPLGAIEVYAHKEGGKWSISMNSTGNGGWVSRLVTLSSDILARHIQNESGSDTIYEPNDEDFVLSRLKNMVKQANSANSNFEYFSYHSRRVFAEMMFNEFMHTHEYITMRNSLNFQDELLYVNIMHGVDEYLSKSSQGIGAFFRVCGVDEKASGLSVQINGSSATVFNSSGDKLFDMTEVAVHPGQEDWKLDLWNDHELTTCAFTTSLWDQDEKKAFAIVEAYEQGNFYNAHTKAVLAKIANKIWNREIEKIKNAKEVNAVDSTVAEVLVRFADCANKRSTDAWNIITSESQQYIIDTMAEAWHKENPGIEIESEDKLKENIRNLFQDPENQVNKAFWKALFDKLIKNGNYDIDISTLATAGDDDKKVVTAGTSAFYLVKEDSQWKIDIMKSEL